jgi:hypothetical protein
VSGRVASGTGRVVGESGAGRRVLWARHERRV